jgi:hypothetical protein
MHLPKTSTNSHLHLNQHLHLPQSQSYSELKTQYNHKNKISNLFYELHPKHSPMYQVQLAKEKMKYSLSSKSLTKPIKQINDSHIKQTKNQQILNQLNIISNHLADEDMTELSNYSFLEPKDSNMDDIHSNTFFPTAITPNYYSSNSNGGNIMGYVSNNNKKEIKKVRTNENKYMFKLPSWNVVIPSARDSLNEDFYQKKDNGFLQYVLLQRKNRKIKKKIDCNNNKSNTDRNVIWRSFQQHSSCLLPNIKQKVFMVKPQLPFDSSVPELSTETRVEIRKYIHKKNNVLPFHH